MLEIMKKKTQKRKKMKKKINNIFNKHSKNKYLTPERGSKTY